MPQITNLNTFPYFDDFDKSNNYYRVLFKPGQPVQARELTTMQSILQNQIEQFGNHIFKDGSVVIPGSLSIRANQYNIKLERTFSGIDVSQYTEFLRGVIVVGEESGVRARVEVVDQYYLFLNLLDSGANGEFRSLVPGESLLAGQNINLTDTGITSFSEGEQIGVIRSIGNGCIAVLTEGVFFLRGYFVEVPSAIRVVTLDDPTPSFDIGLRIFEEFVDVYDDESLYDNSQGFVNFAAAGADRLRITTELFTSYDEREPGTIIQSQNFIELAKVENGRIISSKFENPSYNVLGDELARRTFEESGHYYVKPFSLDVRESLKDFKGNNGVFDVGDITFFGREPNDSIGLYDISAGKAYVFGYEIDKPSNTLIDFVKPRDSKEVKNQSISYVTGPTISINRSYGAPDIGLSTSYYLSLRDERVGSAQTIAAGKEIGLARVYDYALESGSYDTSNPDSNVWDLALFDIVPFTDLIVNENITSLQTPTFIEGKSSGAVGFLRYDVSNSGILTAYNVRGTFIKGESLSFDGNDSDRITIASTTYSISNVKSVHSESGISTFSGDVGQTPIIPLGVCKIDSGGVVTQPGRDFTKDFAINDLVTYNTPGGSNPTINKVSAVTNDNITLGAVQTVSGVCLGTVSSAIDSINISKITTNLLNTNTGDDKFLFTRLPKKVISSVNTTNSVLSYRKRIDTTISADASGGIINILPSELEPGETFLPFDEERYILINKNGQTEELTSDKFTLLNGSTQLQIKGLSVVGSAVLIATLRIDEVKPLTKIRNRVKSITVKKSNVEGSGIGATTLNDGLEYGNYPYGTRVQDKEICLLEPDVTKLYAVYESSTEGEPKIPQMTLKEIDSFNGNATDTLVGEEIFGYNSSCIGIITRQISSTVIEYVPINGKDFIVDEPVTFIESTVNAEISNLVAGDNNITNKFKLIKGVKNTIYDYSRIERVSNSSKPIKSLKIFYEFANIDASDTGAFYSVDSYLNFDYKNIGITNGIRHSDIIDIRPKVSSYTVNEDVRSPFEFLGRSFNNAQNNNLKVLASDESITVDYFYYLPRIDKVYLNKDKVFQVVGGKADEFPEDPIPLEDAIEVARIVLPAYLFNVSDAKISLSSYKRYQMRDIAKLEDRIKNLEYYTTLSLLEQSTANLDIKDSEGTDRFKSGFFVDNFTSTNNQLKFGAKNSIDPKNNELRPASYTTELDLLLGSSELTGIGGDRDPNADPRYVTNLVGNNIRRSTVDPNGSSGSDGMGTITLDYEEVLLVEQLNATRIVNAAPYFVNFYKGTITLNPSSDIWIEQSRIETQTIEGLIGGYSVNNIEANVSDLDPQAGWSPILWGGWNEEWTGSTSTPNTLSNTSTDTDDGVTVDVTSSVTTQTTINTGTATQQGLSTRIETPPGNTISLGDKIIGSNVSSFLRSRNIEILSRRLRPETRMYAFLAGENITKYCIPKLIEIQMISGTFEVGETVESQGTPPGISEDKPYIKFRAAAPRHRNGPYNDPFDGYDSNPYDKTPLSNDYSSTSTTLNVDLASLALQSEGDYFGYIAEGLILVGQSSKARARITNLRLLSDTTGSMFASLFIPNSNSETAPKFKAGNNSLKIQDSPSVSVIEGSLSSAAESIYYSQGTIQQVQGQIISTRNVEVTNAYTQQSQNISEEVTTVVGVDVSVDVNVIPQPIPVPVPQPRPLPRPRPEPRPEPRPRPRVPPAPVGPPPRPTPRVPPRPPVIVPPRPVGDVSPRPSSDNRPVPPPPRPTPAGDTGDFRPVPPPPLPPPPRPAGDVGDVSPPPRPQPAPRVPPTMPPVPRSDARDSGDSPVPRPRTPPPVSPPPRPRPQPRPTGDKPGDEKPPPSPPPPALLPEPYDDPIAQSFFVGNENDKTGVFVTSASLYFQSANENESCFVQLRPMVNGLPSHEAYPMSNVVLQGSDITVSDDASSPTVITFPSPIYLEGNKEHCLVVGSNSTEFNLWVSRLGEVDVANINRPESQQIPITKQSSLGSLFKSQNSYTWTPSQYEDLKYSLNRANFTDRGVISFFNPNLTRGNGQVAILKKDSFQGSSRRIIVGLGTTAVGYGTEIAPGNTIIQDDASGTGNYVMGLGIATGTMTLVNAGIGLTPSSGFFQYDNVSLTKVTGRGENATANIHVNNGVAVGATISAGGNGFKVGDILTGSLGAGVGRNLQLSVSEVFGINEIIIDQVQGDFIVGSGKTLRYINSSGVTSEFSNNASVTLNDAPRIINDGLHIKVNHLNHGMHSPTNRVSISNASSDVIPTRLTLGINSDDVTTIQIDDATNFASFEGVGVGTTNPGYLRIGNEIVGYTTVTGNQLTGITRGVDSTISQEYESGELIIKYESNGVSLRRINKIHDLQDSNVDESIGLDHYNIRIDMSENGTDRTSSSSFPSLFINDTKSFGGSSIEATQNISYEIMKPVISTMTLQKTDITARARTVTSTSVSGNEVSFVDNGYEDISIDKDNYFDTPRLVASTPNANNLLSNLPGRKSFEIELTLKSYDRKLSPVVDLDRLGAIFVSNRVNEVITDYSADPRTSTIKDDPTAFIYATKPIELEIPANNIRVLTAAYINNFSDIRAFYAITNNPEEELVYYPFPGYDNLLDSGQVIDPNDNNGRPDSFVSPVDSTGFQSVSLNFKDYEFTIENLPSFKFFSIKVLATSTNQCYPPRIRDFRAIAFA